MDYFKAFFQPCTVYDTMVHIIMTVLCDRRLLTGPICSVVFQVKNLVHINVFIEEKFFWLTNDNTVCGILLINKRKGGYVSCYFGRF